MALFSSLELDKPTGGRWSSAVLQILNEKLLNQEASITMLDTESSPYRVSIKTADCPNITQLITKKVNSTGACRVLLVCSRWQLKRTSCLWLVVNNRH